MGICSEEVEIEEREEEWLEGSLKRWKDSLWVRGSWSSLVLWNRELNVVVLHYAFHYLSYEL